MRVDVHQHAWTEPLLDECHRDEVDSLLGWGCIGVSLPATALAGADALQAIAAVLERIEARDAPLFILPGPLPSNVSWEGSPTEPPWWRALTDYVAQMQAAWLTLIALWRRDHARLATVFAMLAGGAPLLSERLQTRGGPPVALRDRSVFYDTSSYGPAAVAALASRVGIDQLVYGSDRPVIEPTPNERDEILQSNAAHLLLAHQRGTV